MAEKSGGKHGKTRKSTPPPPHRSISSIYSGYPVQTLEQHPGRQADYWAVGCVIVTFCGEGHCKISREVNQWIRRSNKYDGEAIAMTTPPSFPIYSWIWQVQHFDSFFLFFANRKQQRHTNMVHCLCKPIELQAGIPDRQLYPRIIFGQPAGWMDCRGNSAPHLPILHTPIQLNLFQLYSLLQLHNLLSVVIAHLHSVLYLFLRIFVCRLAHRAFPSSALILPWRNASLWKNARWSRIQVDVRMSQGCKRVMDAQCSCNCSVWIVGWMDGWMHQVVRVAMKFFFRLAFC